MAKLKIRVTPNSSLDEIEEAIEDVLNSGQKEIELKLIIKIVEALGGEHLFGKEGGKGSLARFRYVGLEMYSKYFQDGQFGIHVIHGGKSNKKVYLVNIKKFLVPALRTIIEMKRKGI